MVIKELANKLAIPQNKIKFIGFIVWDEIVPYYQLADAFLNASITETQGLTYIEALACGTPIIVKYDEVLDDVVKEGVNGYFYYEEEALVNYLVKFAEDRTILADLKDKTYETITNYSDDIFAKRIEKIYEDAIKKAKKKIEKS